jgi:hypothetical protein
LLLVLLFLLDRLSLLRQALFFFALLVLLLCRFLRLRRNHVRVQLHISGWHRGERVEVLPEERQRLFAHSRDGVRVLEAADATGQLAHRAGYFPKGQNPLLVVAARPLRSFLGGALQLVEEERELDVGWVLALALRHAVVEPLSVRFLGAGESLRGSIIRHLFTLTQPRGEKTNTTTGGSLSTAKATRISFETAPMKATALSVAIRVAPSRDVQPPSSSTAGPGVRKGQM